MNQETSTDDIAVQRITMQDLVPQKSRIDSHPTLLTLPTKVLTCPYCGESIEMQLAEFG